MPSSNVTVMLGPGTKCLCLLCEEGTAISVWRWPLGNPTQSCSGPHVPPLSTSHLKGQERKGTLPNATEWPVPPLMTSVALRWGPPHNQHVVGSRPRVTTLVALRLTPVLDLSLKPWAVLAGSFRMTIVKCFITPFQFKKQRHKTINKCDWLRDKGLVTFPPPGCFVREKEYHLK